MDGAKAGDDLKVLHGTGYGDSFGDMNGNRLS